MTKVIDATIDKFNRIVVTLSGCDKFGTRKSVKPLVWKAILMPGSVDVFYYTIDGDVVSYLYHNPRNETGFGGAVYSLTMEDGSIVRVKGPWSSRNGCFHALVPNVDVVDCITEGRVVTNVRKEALEALGLKFKVKDNGEKTWELDHA